MDRPQLRDEGALGGVENLGSRDVAGKQVRRALDPAEVGTDRFRDGLGCRGLGQSGNALQQHMPSGEQADHQGLTQPGLAHYLVFEAPDYAAH